MKYDYNEITQGVFLLQNRIRQQPTCILNILDQRLQSLNGRVLTYSDGHQVKTREGAKAIEECIAFLKSQQSLYPLTYNDQLSQAAADHAQDIGSKGIVTHQSSDGSTLKMRVEKYGRWKNLLGENMSFSVSDPQEILLQLLIDDGVQGRGHRNNIFTAAFTVTGIHFTSHRKYSICGVIDYAGQFFPNEIPLLFPQSPPSQAREIIFPNNETQSIENKKAQQIFQIDLNSVSKNQEEIKILENRNRQTQDEVKKLVSEEIKNSKKNNQSQSQNQSSIIYSDKKLEISDSPVNNNDDFIQISPYEQVFKESIQKTNNPKYQSIDSMFTNFLQKRQQPASTSIPASVPKTPFQTNQDPSRRESLQQQFDDSLSQNAPQNNSEEKSQEIVPSFLEKEKRSSEIIQSNEQETILRKSIIQSFNSQMDAKLKTQQSQENPSNHVSNPPSNNHSQTASKKQSEKQLQQQQSAIQSERQSDIQLKLEIQNIDPQLDMLIDKLYYQSLQKEQIQPKIPEIVRFKEPELSDRRPNLESNNNSINQIPIQQPNEVFQNSQKDVLKIPSQPKKEVSEQQFQKNSEQIVQPTTPDIQKPKLESSKLEIPNPIKPVMPNRIKSSRNLIALQSFPIMSISQYLFPQNKMLLPHKYKELMEQDSEKIFNYYANPVNDLLDQKKVLENYSFEKYKLQLGSKNPIFFQLCQDNYQIFVRGVKNEKGKWSKTYLPKEDMIPYLRSLGFLLDINQGQMIHQIITQYLGKKNQQRLSQSRQSIGSQQVVEYNYEVAFLGIYICDQLQANAKELRESLKIFDELNSGILDKNKIKEILCSIGEGLSQEEIKSFYEEFITEAKQIQSNKKKGQTQKNTKVERPTFTIDEAFKTLTLLPY